VSDTSINYIFDTDLKEYDLFFENEKINYPIEKELTVSDLKPKTVYTLVILNNDTKESQIITKTTLTEEIETSDEFYLQYGLIGLMLLILACLFIATKINYVALITVLLSFVGFGYSVANEYGFITTLIFVVFMIISILIYSKGDN
jgi:hypothetical protein